jgi:hypothetical protein
VLKSYSNFISESSWTTVTIRTYFKEGSVFRMYWHPIWDPTYDNVYDDKALEGLVYKEENFQTTSGNSLFFVADDEGNRTGETYYNNLMKNFEKAIERFIFRLDTMSYPALFSLHEGAYLEFTYEAKINGQWDKFLIADTNDDHDTVNVYKRPDKVYPTFMEYIKKTKDKALNDLTDTKFEFHGKAEGFEDTDLYKSYQTVKKYNLFESSEGVKDIKLFFFYKKESKQIDGNIDMVSIDKKDPVEAAKIMFDPNYGKFGMDETKLSVPLYSDSDETYVVVERERKFEKGLNMVYKNTLVQALQEAMDRSVNWTTDELFIFKLHNGTRIQFRNGHLNYNDTNDESLIFELDRGKYRFPHREKTDRLDLEKEAFRFILEYFPNKIYDGNWRKEILDSLSDEERNVYKSIKGGQKYKLFDYASFNESLQQKYTHVVFHSFAESYLDYVQLTNNPDCKWDDGDPYSNPNIKPEKYDLKDYIESITCKLERPISYGEDFYMCIDYADDSVRMKASLDPYITVKALVASFDVLTEQKANDEIGLDPKELFGRAAITNIDSENTTKNAQNFIFDSFRKYSYAHKAYDDDNLKSYNDELVYKALVDLKAHGETIKRVIWNDPKFAEKHNLLKTVKTLKKFDI